VVLTAELNRWLEVAGLDVGEVTALGGAEGLYGRLLPCGMCSVSRRPISRPDELPQGGRKKLAAFPIVARSVLEFCANQLTEAEVAGQVWIRRCWQS
jgi:hypothetical protein